MHASSKEQDSAERNLDIQIDVKKLTVVLDNNFVDQTETKHKHDIQLLGLYNTRNRDSGATDEAKESATVTKSLSAFQGKKTTIDNYSNIRQDEVDRKSTNYKGSFWCSSRCALIVIGFLGFLILYALRVNMSVSIVCMTRPETNTSKECNYADGNDSQSNITVECDIPKGSKQDDEFDWDKETQGLILGSFFLGYALTQIPGGWLARKYGGKRLYGWSMFVCAVATLLTPFAARTSVALLLVVRVVVGLCQGVVFPCMHVLLSYWIPPLQRSSSASFVYSGTQIGVMVAFPVSGVLCADGFDGGWPSIFYVFGCLGIVWCLVWMYLVFDTPVSHPRIAVKEREYITDKLKSDIDISKKSSSTPWSKIFTSLPVWAIVVSLTCAEWGTYSFLTNIPSYMEDVLSFDIRKAGFLSSLPYLGFWVVSNMSALLVDFLRKRGYMSTTTARKTFNSIGNVIPAIFIAITGNVADDPGLAVAMLALGMAMSGCQFGSGFLINPVDIAPRYAGIILGIANTGGALGGFFAPVAIGMITVDKTREQWKTVFYIVAAVYTFGTIFYVIFGSGELQQWALNEEDNREIDAMDKKAKIEIKTVDEEVTHL